MIGHTHLFWSLSGLFSDRFFHTKLDIGVCNVNKGKLKNFSNGFLCQIQIDYILKYKIDL